MITITVNGQPSNISMLDLYIAIRDSGIPHTKTVNYLTETDSTLVCIRILNMTIIIIRPFGYRVR